MPSQEPTPQRAIVGFFATSLGLTAVLLALGMLLALAWNRALAPAIVVGVGCGLLAAMIGALPVLLFRHRSGAEGVPVVLMSMIFRVVAAILLVLVALQVSDLDPQTLVLSLVVTHAVLQVADIRLAKQLLFKGGGNFGKDLGQDLSSR